MLCPPADPSVADFCICLAELSTLLLLTLAAMLALPIARFGGFAWLIAVGALLPRAARSRRPRPRPPAAPGAAVALARAIGTPCGGHDLRGA